MDIYDAADAMYFALPYTYIGEEEDSPELRAYSGQICIMVPGRRPMPTTREFGMFGGTWIRFSDGFEAPVSFDALKDSSIANAPEWTKEYYAEWDKNRRARLGRGGE